jgi:putative ABC transport system ATP-binding protein
MIDSIDIVVVLGQGDKPCLVKGRIMIELHKVSKQFGNGVPIVALAPSAGSIVVDSVDISTASRKELFEFRRTSVSFIFQSFNIFPGLTASENVQFGADVTGRDDIDPTSVLGSVGLGERVDQFPHELSGGEQQRVAIARALATGNPVMLADEPTGELDFATGVQILELLQKQAAEGRAVLVVTHNREISRVADRVVELSSGRIVSDGPPTEGKARLEDLHW